MSNRLLEEDITKRLIGFLSECVMDGVVPMEVAPIRAKEIYAKTAEIVRAEERAYIKRIGAKWSTKTVAQIISLIEINEQAFKKGEMPK